MKFLIFLTIFCYSGIRALNVNDDCNTPDGKAGTCIYVKNCEQIVTLLKKNLNSEELTFVKNSECGREGRKVLVCCANQKKVLPQPPQECGMDLSDRIIGGTRAKINQFPWLVLLQYEKPKGLKGFHCGGSLISRRYVLTAAHCIRAIPKTWKLIAVRLGEWDLSSEEDCEEDECTRAVDIDVEKIMVHENYDAGVKAQYNDITLLRLTQEVQLTDFIQPVCLPTQKDKSITGSQFFVGGWGKTETETQSQYKLYVDVNGVDLASCNQKYSVANIQLKETQLCAGGVIGKDSCKGDSGGSLMKKDGFSWYLYGIVSFGPKNCGQTEIPGVYTKVSHFVDWVEKNIEP